jgi:anti-anti-sigma regulatory factor
MMTMAGVTAREQVGWLTTILRPAGSLDQSALHRLSESLGHLAACSNMVIIDLTAADVGNPRTFARELLGPALAFEQAGQCLLLVGASPKLTAELDRTAVPVVTLAADAMPLQSA